MGEADPSQTTKGENLNGGHRSDKVSGMSPRGRWQGEGDRRKTLLCAQKVRSWRQVSSEVRKRKEYGAPLRFLAHRIG